MLLVRPNAKPPMPHWQTTDPAKAAARAESVAPCAVSVWRAADGTVHFVVDDTHIGTDDSELLDGRIMGRGEGADSVLAWFKETASKY